MKGDFGLENVDTVQATMTITMSLKEWKELRATIGERWPGWKFASFITQIVNKAEKEYFEREDLKQ